MIGTRLKRIKADARASARKAQINAFDEFCGDQTQRIERQMDNRNDHRLRALPQTARVRIAGASYRLPQEAYGLERRGTC